MDEDDLPPPQPVERDSGFSGELGRTVSGFVWVALFVAVVAGVLLVLKHWF